MSHHHKSQLEARRKECITEAQAIVERGERGASLPGDNAKFDDLMEEADTIVNKLKLYELSPQSQRIQNLMDTPPAGSRPRDRSPEYRAFDNFLRNGMSGLNSDDRAQMMKLHDPQFRAAQGVGTDSAGGFAVPDEHMRTMVEALKSTGGLMAAATIIHSETGADLPIPTDNETAVEGAIVAENVALGEFMGGHGENVRLGPVRIVAARPRAVDSRFVRHGRCLMLFPGTLHDGPPRIYASADYHRKGPSDRGLATDGIVRTLTRRLKRQGFEALPPRRHGR